MYATALLALFVLAPAAWAEPPPHPSVAASPSPAPVLQELTATERQARNAATDRIKGALLEAEPQLGHLEPWQKVLFEEEAVPQAQRFIRNYTGSSADIDFDSLKNYLRFHARDS